MVLNAMLPNFLIIGAARAGTTSLWDFLKAHPQVYMPYIKETNFFALEGTKADFNGPGDDKYVNRWAVTTFQGYERLFEGVTDQVAIGEASPLYMYHPDAPRRIKAYIPHAKIVAILRNPADRAFSSFMHVVRDRREPLTDFAAAVLRESERISAGWEHIWHYKAMGFYHSQLSRYYSIFDSDQIKIYLFDDFLGDQQAVLDDLMRFLGIEKDLATKLKKTNGTSWATLSRSMALNSLLTDENFIKRTAKRLMPASFAKTVRNRLMSANQYKPKLTKSARRDLMKCFREDIKNLEKLINRDLSAWMDV